MEQPNLFPEGTESEAERRIRVRNEFADKFTHADVNPVSPAGWDPELDKVRLRGQMGRVAAVLSDGEMHTLAELARTVSGSQTGVSARIRDLRKARFGAHQIDRVRLSGGTWGYRMVPQSSSGSSPPSSST